MFPADAINKYYPGNQAMYKHIDEFAANSPETQELCEKADIIILERNFWGDVLTQIMFWKVRGKKIVTLFDDAYPYMTRDNPAYSFWKHGEVTVTNEQTKKVSRVYNNIPPLTLFKWGNQLSNAIQVPNKVMQQDWSVYNDTYYLHNYIDPEKYINSERIQKHDDIIIGWHGSLSHRHSFENSGVVKAVRNVIRKYPNTRFLIGGDRHVVDFISLPVGRKLFQPYVPEEQWGGTLKNFDIALAPLSGEYDRRRSWVRGIEYMACQLPCIGTRCETYDELEGHMILVDNGAENWENAISEMVENIQQHRERVREEPYKFALEQSYEKNMWRNLEVYKKVIEQPYK
jgi:glycosyltransferase involved in cell wall biosynthesis